MIFPGKISYKASFCRLSFGVFLEGGEDFYVEKFITDGNWRVGGGDHHFLKVEGYGKRIWASMVHLRCRGAALRFHGALFGRL